MKSLQKTLVLLAMMLFCFASVMYANPVNCAATPSNPACAPTFVMTYQATGGGPITLVPAGTPAYGSGSWLTSFTAQTITTPAGVFVFSGGQEAGAPDPFVGFSFGVVNTTTGNLTFTYSFTTPFAGGPYYQAQTIFADVLIDAAFAGTATVSPNGDPFIMESFINSTMIPGFGRGTGCTTAPSPLFFCQSGAIGSIGPVPYTSPASGNLTVSGSFILTPGSQYTLTGRTELLAVPEPGSLVLLGSGLIGLAGLARRRMSK